MNYMNVEGFPGATAPRKKKKKQLRPAANAVLPARTVAPIPQPASAADPNDLAGMVPGQMPPATSAPAAGPVDYAQAETEELEKLLQPQPQTVEEPVTAKGVESGVDVATLAPGVSPGSPVAVTPAPAPAPAPAPDPVVDYDAVPGVDTGVDLADAPAPVDPNAAANAAAAEYKALQEAEAEAARQREADEFDRLQQAEFDAYRQRNRGADAGLVEDQQNRELAALEEAELQQRQAAQTEQQRLDDMEQERLRTELSTAQRDLADLMGATTDPTTVTGAEAGAGAAPGLTELDETMGYPTVPTETDPSLDTVSPEIAAAGGYTDRELRQQQMQEQHRILTAAEALAAERAGGLERERPELLATGDVSYDPEYFGYETDLQKVILDALRQNLTGAGGMDMQTASQIADLEHRQAKDETQTMEDLNRLGVLRGGGDTADVLGELRSGYGRTYADIMGAAQGRRDPQLEAAMDLARMASDRYMTGGEMIGRLGGQNTLEARLAQQEALERGEDLQRGDVMLEQDIADRALARGMTLTEPTTRERFEEGVRGAQEAEALARAGVTGYLGDQSTIERERMLDLERERDQAMALEQTEARELERELAAGQVSLEGEEDRVKTIAGQEVGSEERMQSERIGAEERMQTERVDADKAMLNRELGNRVTMGQIDRSKAKDVQRLINDGRVKEAAALLDVREAELESAETMEEGRLDMAREMAAGEVTIDGRQVKTLDAGRLELEEDLTNAQLQQLYRTEQGQSIANMLALMNTLPEKSKAREELEGKIGKAVEVGIANNALAGTIRDMLGVTEADFVRQAEGDEDDEDTPQVKTPVKTPVGTGKYNTEEDWIADNPVPKGYEKRGGEVGKEPPKYKTHRGVETDQLTDEWIAWNRRNTEFSAWDRRRQDLLDGLLDETGQGDAPVVDAGTEDPPGILDLGPEPVVEEGEDDTGEGDDTEASPPQYRKGQVHRTSAWESLTPRKRRQAVKQQIITDFNADVKKSWRGDGSDVFVVRLSDGSVVWGDSTTGEYSQIDPTDSVRIYGRDLGEIQAQARRK